MEFLIKHWSGFIVLLVAMIGLVELGRRIGQRRMRADAQWNNHGVSTIENALLALLGLLLAFSFTGAWSRFDARRDLILRETNAIGTAWLRLELLPAPEREHLRNFFRQYADMRIEAAKSRQSKPSEKFTALEQTLWREATAASLAAPDGRLGQILLPALNDMFDIATARFLAVQTHPPTEIFLMLLVITMLSCLVVGHGMAGSRQRNWLHPLCFTLAIVLIIYVTIDLEYPRLGLIRVDGYDDLLVDVRSGMK